METEERSAGVVGFMTTRIGVLMLRCGHESGIVKMHCFFGDFFFTPRHGSSRCGYGDDVSGEVHRSCVFHDPQGGHSCARVWPCV